MIPLLLLGFAAALEPAPADMEPMGGFDLLHASSEETVRIRGLVAAGGPVVGEAVLLGRVRPVQALAFQIEVPVIYASDGAGWSDSGVGRPRASLRVLPFRRAPEIVAIGIEYGEVLGRSSQVEVWTDSSRDSLPGADGHVFLEITHEAVASAFTFHGGVGLEDSSWSPSGNAAMISIPVMVEVGGTYERDIASAPFDVVGEVSILPNTWNPFVARGLLRFKPVETFLVDVGAFLSVSNSQSAEWALVDELGGGVLVQAGAAW